MSNVTSEDKKVSLIVAEELPYLRRYARALTGSQGDGDRYAAATLEALLNDRSVFHDSSSPRVALYKMFNAIWNSLDTKVGHAENSLVARAQQHLAKLTSNTREALLLSTVENFHVDEISEIMGLEGSDVKHLIDVAMREMTESVAGDILIIEDEGIIAMDLQEIVSVLGHRVSGIARTADEARDLARKRSPDLILSDIQLADNSSGIDAVNDILAEELDTPVIFITAFPERLLTGERTEPAFLITKPYTEEQVRAAVSQAMFFSSTETLAPDNAGGVPIP